MAVRYTLVLWCADTSRFASMMASHLLSAGIAAANRGRIDDEIPIAVGVANARRWPIFSREVAASGLIRAKAPQVTTTERYDYLLTVASGASVDAANAPSSRLPVISAAHLARALDQLAPSEMSKADVLKILTATSQPPNFDSPQSPGSVDVHGVADICQQLVSALAR